MSFEMIEVELPFGKQIVFDVTGYIRSEDMKNLVKAGLPVTDPDYVEQIILYSNLSVKEKALELRKLATYTRHLGNFQEYENMAVMLELSLEQIITPKEKVLYIWQRTGDERYLYYDSFDTLMTEWNDHRDNKMDETGKYNEILPSCDHVTQLFIGGKETEHRLDFTMQWLDGKYEIRSVQPDSKWLRAKGIADSTIEQYWRGLDLCVLGLTFPEDEEWVLRTPSMERNAYGEFENSEDGHTVFFYAKDEGGGLTGYAFDSLDVDHSGDMYSVLDWLEKAPEENDLDYELLEELPFD